MEGEQQQLDEWARSRHTRLPSFSEVLSRRTRPPVDLFMFYLFLQREGAEDILDFWLDVQQHENLCRAYFKDVRKSGRTIREDWPEYWEYARRRGTASTAEMAAEMQEKRGLTERSTSPDPRLLASTSPATAVGTDLEHALGSPTPAQPRPPTPFSLGRHTPIFFSRRASRAPTILPRSSPITRTDLVASAERIFLRYLSPAGTSPGGGESHEIYLPPALRVHSFPLSNATGSAADQAGIAQVPDMFHAQKEYCFRAMEQDAFPRFLRSKAFGNLTPMSALVRLVAGLVSLWIGLATAFSLVFLDVKPKSVRFYLFIPFTFALLFLISHQYELDPILVFFEQSETTPFRTLRIREPYVRKLLIGRAIWVSMLVAVGVTALTLLFWAVPGHRL
ncbi:RGS domain-containing protein [Multifurca ochricompacta]|uniref:RGS domain-containing protein n=1 Tax=Multifurca ochricompacta TaxID=376703 RepID=A0AAD4M5K3_9AGAM|nr:RGS domain-containing protein [Multifurca ochricompacta]